MKQGLGQQFRLIGPLSPGQARSCARLSRGGGVMRIDAAHPFRESPLGFLSSLVGQPLQQLSDLSSVLLACKPIAHGTQRQRDDFAKGSVGAFHRYLRSSNTVVREVIND